MWNGNLDLTITSYSLNHIMGRVKDEEREESWFFSGIYGFPDET